jgi:hypothetical protein
MMKQCCAHYKYILLRYIVLPICSVISVLSALGLAGNANSGLSTHVRIGGLVVALLLGSLSLLGLLRLRRIQLEGGCIQIGKTRFTTSTIARLHVLHSIPDSLVIIRVSSGWYVAVVSNECVGALRTLCATRPCHPKSM